MTPAALRAAGHVLFGDEATRAMARALGASHPGGARDMIDDSLVRKWLRGARPVPAWVAPAVADLLDAEADATVARAALCRGLARDLRLDAA